MSEMYDRKVENEVKRIVCYVLEIDEESVDGSSNLFKLGLNSLDKIRIMVGLESEFKVEFTQDEDYMDDKFTNIREIVSLVKKYFI